MAEENALNSYIKPTWCPGCGNHALWAAIKKAILGSGVGLERVVLSYDVGCSSNMADFNKLYGFHGLHGRAVPPASGIKLANHELTVVAIIGDGGCYGEGLTHWLNEMRGNHDICVIVHDNHRYSLTTGQMSPTTPKGTKTQSTPFGSIEEPLNPIALALANKATFVARAFAGEIEETAALILEGIKHVGFAVVDVLQPCMVFNKEMDYDWYRAHTEKLKDLGHQTNDREAALKQAMRADKLATGLFYQEEREAYHQADVTLKKGPLVKQSLEGIDIGPLLEEFK